MFEELFTQIKTIKEYQSAPLVEERLRYLVHYAERGASRYTLRAVAANQLSLVRLLDLLGEEGVCVPVSRLLKWTPLFGPLQC